ncbi:SRPBCC domain-containing protein [Chitinophaga sp. MM2321]|uniref:SRPBCC family protein n=1 Tax=Chitinophaga sp. MM2321 TaxID=3137178 RepID=UPI0032D587FB
MEKSNTKNEVNITHIFNAPRELVFKAWTEPEQLLRWFAPDDCTISFKSIDVQKGGTFHSCIHSPIHGDCWCKGVYLEVVAPERLVYTIVITDEQGNTVEPVDVGKSAALPAATILTVTFTEYGNKTELTLHQTMSEKDAKQTGAYQGWLLMLNRLEALISNQSA